MKRRQLMTAGAALATLPLSRPAIAQPANSRVLRFVPHADLANPDPVWSTALVVSMHSYLVWDRLYGLDENFVPRPQMVGGEEVTDNGLTWTLTLREGLVYSDGEKVRAADAVASILRTAKRQPLVETLMAMTNELVAVDDNRVRFRLKRPFALVPRALNDVVIMPERIAKTDAFTQINEYVGSGPYRFVREEWRAGTGAIYVRNDRYVPRNEPVSMLAGGKVAHFERVEWTTMPDPSTSAAALQQGEVDWVDTPLIDLLPSLRRVPGVEVAVFDKLGDLMSMFFNQHQAPFNNAKLRQAVLAAVDQQDFVDAVLGEQAKELGRVGVGVFPPGSPYASDAAMDRLTGPRDIAAARKMVADSGYKGERIVLMSPSDLPNLRASSLVADSVFKALGLNVEFASMDWGTLIQRRNSGEPVEKGGWGAYCTSWTGLSIASPATHLPMRLNGSAAKAWWRPDDAEMERLRSAWFAAPDLAGRQQVAAEMQRRALTEVVPFIPLGLSFRATAFRSNLTGHARSGFPVFWGVRRTA
jgi:peptide/nickel transport system substrate-binding protein